MRDVTPETLTGAFAAYATNAPDARTRDVLCALARHMHAFVKEVHLTHEEWRTGLAALTAAGEITSDARNEFGLFSDLFGVSSLVDMLNSPPGATSSSNMGPFHRRGAPELPNGGDLRKDQEGDPLAVVGQVTDTTGKPVPHAVLDLWQTAGNGLYAIQDANQPQMNYHAQLRADAEGKFCFTTVKPLPYTVPYDGPAGAMLRALNREAWRPSHLHVIVEAPGHVPVVTEIFPTDDEFLDRDAVFGVRADLLMEYRQGTDPDNLPANLAERSRMPEGFWRVDLHLRMAPIAA